MVTSIDIRHRLTESGFPHPKVRHQALRVARLIEHGRPLEAGQMIEPLIDCSRRPGRRPCEASLWVVKTGDDRAEAFCSICKPETVVNRGWQDSDWAGGRMERVDFDERPWEH